MSSTTKLREVTRMEGRLSQTRGLSTDAAIKIVPIGAVDSALLDYLSFVLPGRFEAPCVVSREVFDPKGAYHATRRQYHSTDLLARLHALESGRGGKILAVSELDLFIPIFTFVFGEAQVGGCVALVSIHRLSQQFYGLPEDRQLLFTRAEKEATHELGHAYGLAHCRSYDCVMRFSNSVEDVDLRASEFCPSCEASLRARLGSSLAA